MTQTSFDQRVSRIAEKHRRLSLGVTYRVGSDGLLIATPQRRYMPRFPLKPLVMLLVLSFGFKALLFIGLGEGVYEARRATLAEGNAAERGAAWVMQPDPLVRAVADIALESGML